jgi:hypothetical protein
MNLVAGLHTLDPNPSQAQSPAHHMTAFWVKVFVYKIRDEGQSSWKEWSRNRDGTKTEPRERKTGSAATRFR